MERNYRSSCSSPRSRSAPKVGKPPRTPSSFYAFPSTLQEILYGPRQRLTKYADGMRALPLAAPLPINTDEEAAEMKKTEVMAAAEPIGVEATTQRSKEDTLQNPNQQEQQPAADTAVAVAVDTSAEENSANTLQEATVSEKEKVEEEEEEVRLPGETPADAAIASSPPPEAGDAEKEEEEKEDHDEGSGEAAAAGADEVQSPAEADADNADISDTTEPETAAEVAAAEQKQEGEEKTTTEDQTTAAAEQNPEDSPADSTTSTPHHHNNDDEKEKAADGRNDDETSQQPDHHDTTTTPSAESEAEKDSSDKPGRNESAKDHQQPADEEADLQQDNKTPEDLPQLRATAECVAFDPAQVETWMSDFRHDATHTPAGVQSFVRDFDKIATKFNLKIAGPSASASPVTVGAAGPGGKKGKKSAFANATGSPKTSASGAPLDLAAREVSFGGAVAAAHGANGGSGGAAGGGKKSSALEALGDVWEGRQETPISLAQGSLRRRGLFGEVEKKKIHHMVVAVLNKVTTDPAKFREVRNELLRLPIPEANAEQLAKIVDAFFTKAVREQHFCHSYADLIVALCKVPQGQHIVGDKTQSLEYRLRAALLKRCQSEFVQSVKAEAAPGSTAQSSVDDVSSPLTAAITTAEEAGGETEKERRDRMCGNVRFVCELFLRDVVVGSVVSFILRMCLLGSEFGEFIIPPTYTPTESQVDEVITAVKTVKERFFVQNAEGRRMLPLVLGQLDYWVQHYPISRCRFVLMSVVDDLRAMLPPPQVPPPPSAAAPAGEAAVAEPANGSGSASELALVTAQGSGKGVVGLPAPREVSDSVSGSPLAAAVVSVADGSQSPTTSTMVGGQPLPAPRSRQAGNASVSESTGSFAGNAHAESSAAAAVVGSPLLAIALTLSSRQQLQPVRPEAIAKLMAALASGQCTPREIATQLFDQYGNVLPALAAWMDRSLSVAKEDKARKQTGALLVACAEHLTAHLAPSSPEWAETVAACREQVHEVAIEALQRALEAKLYEDLHIFGFWAQLVLSDHDRALYDEELLNEGLELIAYTAPAALRNYLVEVSKYMNAALLKPDTLPWYPATEAHNFVRFRPLLVLHSLVLGGGAKEAQAVLDGVLAFSDVRQQSLEMRLYHAFHTGAPSREVIFEQLRSAPRLTSRDPTFAAEVLSALLIAELCSDGTALVENNMDLLQITVDGVNRGDREMAVVAEVYEVLRYAPKALPRTAAARVLQKFVFMHILSDETMDRADRFYAAEGEGVIEKSDKEDGRVLEGPLPPPPPHAAGPGLPSAAELPRIADRHPTDELLSASTSLRSVGGANTGMGVSAEGTVTDFRAHANGGNSAEGLPSSTTSSLAEFRPHSAQPHQHQQQQQRPSQPHQQQQPTQQYAQPPLHLQGGQDGYYHQHQRSSSNSRRSPRQPSPTRSYDDSLRGFHGTSTGSANAADDASKRLLRNSYKNRRRSHEAGSELISSAGGSKDVSPQQHPVAHTPLSSTNENSLENSRTRSGSTSRYGRGYNASSNTNNNHNSSSSHHGGSSSNGGGRGGSRGGRGGSDRGGGGGDRGSRGAGRGRGGPSSTHRGSGGRGSERGGRGGHDDTRRGNGRYNTRGNGGSNRD